MFNSTLSAESEDFYYKLYESNAAKNTSIVAAFIFSLFIVPELIGIIVFEKFGSDKKRTIINMMITSMCYSTFQGKATMTLYFNWQPIDDLN